MGTTANGYPYPEDTDPVTGGAQAIKALANKIDTFLRTTASGSTTITLSNVAYAQVVVTLPAGRFTTTPNIAVGCGANAFFAGVASKSATSFTAWTRVWNNTATSGSVPVDWIAGPA
jgi:hypothetical protein